MNKTFLDYLIFRVISCNPLSIFEDIKGFFLASECLEMGGQGRGKDGWTYRREVTFAEKLVFTIDYGGDSQRGWARVVLQGGGCGFVLDWRGLSEYLAAKGQIRRVDIAHDSRDGTVTHEKVLAAYAEGKFHRSGRPPKLKKIEGSDKVDGSTVYVGSRTSPIFLRCYEKGWQLLDKAAFPRQFMNPEMIVDFGDGFGLTRVADYYRLEVELKAEGNSSLPFELLHSPDGYFAGINPFFAEKVDSAPVAIPRLPNAFETLDLDSGIKQARLAYGGLLAAAAKVYGDSIEAKARIFDMVSAGEVPARWQAAARLAEPMARGGCEARPSQRVSQP